MVAIWESTFKELILLVNALVFHLQHLHQFPEWIFSYIIYTGNWWNWNLPWHQKVVKMALYYSNSSLPMNIFTVANACTFIITSYTMKL